MSKPFPKLKRADFEQAPVWSWLLDGDDDAADEDVDESFVRPTPFTAVPRSSFAQFLVASTVQLKDGSVMPGIAEVTVAGDDVGVQPTTIFLLDRQLQIPGVETNRLLARYTKSLENYPVGWALTVPIEGEAECRSGTIEDGDMRSVVDAGMQALMMLKRLRGDS